MPSGVGSGTGRAQGPGPRPPPAPPGAAPAARPCRPPSTHGNSRRRRSADGPCPAPLPAAVNLFLSRWSCDVEPEIWKNLTRSRFRHRKTLFRVNTGTPPSSPRNAEPVGLRSAASQKSRGRAALLGLRREGWRGAPAALRRTWPSLEPRAQGVSRLRNLGSAPTVPTPEHSASGQDPSCLKRPPQSLDLRGAKGDKGPRQPKGPRMRWDFPFHLASQPMTKSLFLEEERSLRVPARAQRPPPGDACAGWGVATRIHLALTEP